MLTKTLTILLFPLLVNSRELIKIAVIDSGYTKQFNQTLQPRLCFDGHYDFIDKKSGVGEDTVGHGSNIVYTITKKVSHKNYCLMIYRVFSNKGGSPATVTADAINLAVKNGAKVINLSIGTSANYSQQEQSAIQAAAYSGVKMFVAAGNNKLNLNEVCTTYPACYASSCTPVLEENFIVVGALEVSGQKAPYSNSGSIVKRWYYGVSMGLKGTSQATAYATSEYVNYLWTKRD